MKTIYKYPFAIEDNFTLTAPKNARVCAIQVQDGTPCIWMYVDTEVEQIEYEFHIYGTGHECFLCGLFEYIATIQLDGFAWHICYKHPLND